MTTTIETNTLEVLDIKGSGLPEVIDITTGDVGVFEVLMGPPGPPGEQGATGADSTVPGPAGPVGPAGPTGPQGAPSTVPGPTGPTGPQGVQGPQGAPSTVPGPTGPQGLQGLTGPQGPTGADSTVPGPQGATGPPGASTSVFRYRARTGVLSGDPTPGRLGWNSSNQAASTGLNVDQLDDNGQDVSIGLGTLRPGDKIYLQDAATASNYQHWTVNTVTNMTGYFAAGVSLIGSGGTGSSGFPQNQSLTMRVSLLGPTGPQGTQGPQGPKGDKGDVGSGSRWYSGVGAPFSTAPPIGDWYLDTSSGEVWEKTSSNAWTLRANLTGPRGLQGIPGPTGATGTAGATGATGPQGPQGAQGPAGATGPAGPKGDKGDKGDPGTGGGTGADEVSVGDTEPIDPDIELWIDTTGDAPPMAPMAAGNSIITGPGAPDEGTGTDGDFYIDTATGDRFGPKDETSDPVWPDLTAQAEVYIGEVEPNPSVELWMDTTAGQPPELKYRDPLDDTRWVLYDLSQQPGAAGATGPQGIAGEPGEPGPEGPQGIQGIQGDPGVPGEAGPTGPQGQTGEQGLQGDPGVPGEAGPKGDTGDPGPEGPQGLQGEQGVQGEQGIQGDQGDTGEQGPTGAISGQSAYSFSSGITEPPQSEGQLRLDTADQPAATKLWLTKGGMDGLDLSPSYRRLRVGDLVYLQDYDDASSWVLYTATAEAEEKDGYFEIAVAFDEGSTSPLPYQKIQVEIQYSGVQGPAGPPGSPGAQGIPGVQGVQGPVGATGTQGPKGDIGPTGPASTVPGPQGPQGLVGAQGPKGDPGATGATGSQGQQGVQGPIGATGSQGPQGIQGVQGVIGSTGAQGPTGATGATGPTPYDGGYAEMTGSASVSVPSGAWTKVAGMTLSAATSRLVGLTTDANGPIVQTPALYQAELAVAWGSSKTGRRTLGFVTATADVAPTLFNQSGIQASSLGVLPQTASLPLVATAAGTRVYLIAYQDSGSAVAITDRRILLRRTGPAPA